MKKIKTFYRALKSRLIKWVIPKRARRMILVSSLYGLFVPNPTQESIVEFKRSFDEQATSPLQTRPEGMYLPIHIGKSIWCRGTLIDPQEIKRALLSNDVKFLNKLFARNLPCWMIYDDRKKVIGDFLTVARIVGGPVTA